MSRFDRADPAEDAEYCRGLSGGSPVKSPVVLTCQCCDFRGDFCAAVAHYRVTGHELEYRGMRQDLSEVGR